MKRKNIIKAVLEELDDMLRLLGSVILYLLIGVIVFAVSILIGSAISGFIGLGDIASAAVIFVCFYAILLLYDASKNTRKENGS